jgi:polysaccharide biosynthesis/export protein
MGRKLLLGFMTLCLATMAPLMAADQSVTTDTSIKALVGYIEEARKLGLKDGDLRQNAVAAGWKPDQVDEAMKQIAAAPPAAAAPSADGATEPAAGTSSDSTTVPTVQDPKPDRGVGEEYQIGSGDILQIQVWKEPEASVQSVIVRADGKIAVPFIKEVTVVGMTPVQAEKIITTRLKPFYRDPEVSVIVREVHSKKVYLVGAVRHAGTFDLKYPMTVLQCLTEAGGPTDFAKKKKIYVLRTEGGKEFRFPFNYEAVLRGEMMEQNIWIMPNDMIVVP